MEGAVGGDIACRPRPRSSEVSRREMGWVGVRCLLVAFLVGSGRVIGAETIRLSPLPHSQALPPLTPQLPLPSLPSPSPSPPSPSLSPPSPHSPISPLPHSHLPLPSLSPLPPPLTTTCGLAYDETRERNEVIISSRPPPPPPLSSPLGSFFIPVPSFFPHASAFPLATPPPTLPTLAPFTALPTPTILFPRTTVSRYPPTYPPSRVTLPSHPPPTSYAVTPFLSFPLPVLLIPSLPLPPLPFSPCPILLPYLFVLHLTPYPYLRPLHSPSPSLSNSSPHPSPPYLSVPYLHLPLPPSFPYLPLPSPFPSPTSSSLPHTILPYSHSSSPCLPLPPHTIPHPISHLILLIPSFPYLSPPPPHSILHPISHLIPLPPSLPPSPAARESSGGSKNSREE
ncbi:hypothetical protein C7M84_022560 [Penaeus vannamei]|uniref:Uncharacterized protein n=1 Tax=Penaeus vannamei TaxID=6689 RepID=A0A423U6C9_PENVA|nr:hypothetical protein C7M84_022560 [Penaeus vannamei]